MQDRRKYQHAIRKASRAPVHYTTQANTAAQEVFHLNNPQQWVQKGPQAAETHTTGAPQTLWDLLTRWQQLPAAVWVSIQRC